VNPKIRFKIENVKEMDESWVNFQLIVDDK
jgi:hypothetical protein